MAAKKKQLRDTGRWQAAPNDAIRLAALRWFALEIEQTCIEMYATNAASYHTLEKELRRTVHKLHQHQHKLSLGAETCPDGYVLCGETCAPMCANE